MVQACTWSLLTLPYILLSYFFFFSAHCFSHTSRIPSFIGIHILVEITHLFHINSFLWKLIFWCFFGPLFGCGSKGSKDRNFSTEIYNHLCTSNLIFYLPSRFDGNNPKFRWSLKYNKRSRKMHSSRSFWDCHCHDFH